MGMNSSNFSSHANRGRNLESVVMASQGNTVTLNKITAGQKWLRGGKTVAQMQFVDFTGCVNGSGRMLIFDAKQWGSPKCRLDLVPPLQRGFLRRYQVAGAIAGLLIESTVHRKFFWFGEYPVFEPIGWDSPLLIELGPTTHGVSFERIPGVSRAEPARSIRSAHNDPRPLSPLSS